MNREIVRQIKSPPLHNSEARVLVDVLGEFMVNSTRWDGSCGR